MSLKLGMTHQALELYKVCIHVNHKPGMSLTYFTTRSTYVAYAFEWGKIVKMGFDGQNVQEMSIITGDLRF